MKAYDLAKLRILVTGATGFLGSHLCQSLRALGSEIHAISRRQQCDNAHLHWWNGDLSQFEIARRLVKEIQPDVIFHLTAHAWGGPGVELVQPTLRDDLIATVNLLTAASELNLKRVVLTGSLEEPQPGADEPIPSSPYAAAKWASGAYARMFHQLYRMPVVILRVFMTYGPRQPPKKLIPYTILSLLNGKSPKLSDGRRRIDWIYVDDVIRGLILAAQVPGIEGATFDIGSGHLRSIREAVGDIVARVSPGTRPMFGVVPTRPMERIRVANIEETRIRLGWSPLTSWEDGLDLTIDWYKNAPPDQTAVWRE